MLAQVLRAALGEPTKRRRAGKKKGRQGSLVPFPVNEIPLELASETIHILVAGSAEF